MTDNQYMTEFVEAIATVFETISERRVTYTGTLQRQEDHSNNISIVIGLVGDVNGNFYMSMNAHIGCRIASELLGGMEINEVDELVTSAVSELGNMIMGNTCSNLSRENIKVDITPPQVFWGDVNSLSSVQPIYIIPVEVEDLGIIDFDMMIKTA